jgi:hypothetical protein
MLIVRWSKFALALLNFAAWTAVSFVPPSSSLPRSHCWHRHHCRPSLLHQTPNDENDRTILIVEEEEEVLENRGRRDLLINVAVAGLLAATGVASWSMYKTEVYTPTGFRRLPTVQFLAVLGDPRASSGRGAENWGLWRMDPGPRGVWLSDYEKQLVPNDGVAPRGGWKFDENDWWVEEHGLIMEAPDFPVLPGRYLVTGGRSVTTGLTIRQDGSWKLDEGTLYDVTHLPCRAARYQPNEGGGSPLTANRRDFPVAPGAAMPTIAGTNKQDYAVLFVVGKAA